jgi:putative ABC transport system permease protein
MRLLPFDYAVRNLGRSPSRLIGTLVSAVLVVLLILSAGGFVRGMEKSLAGSARAENVIILGAGSEESVERSEISASVAGQVLASIDGIRQQLGVPYVSPEIHMATVLRTAKDAEQELQAVLRGVTPAAFLVHPQVRITRGRAPREGHDELLVGDLAAARMGVSKATLDVGNTLWFDGRPWTIVGWFSAPGTVKHAEIWLPLQNLLIANKRQTVSCVVVTLDGAEFADVDAFCKQRLDLELVAIRESEYYAKLSQFYTPIRAMVWVTAGLIGLGGLLGGITTSYGAFVARIRELGTLQTLGFSRLAIVISMIQESVLIASTGAIIAAVAALVFLSDLSVRFSMGAFALTIDAPVLAAGLGMGFVFGVVGALPPAWRCLRLPVRDALYTA